VSSGHGDRYGLDFYPPLVLAQAWVPGLVAVAALVGLLLGLKTRIWSLVLLLLSMAALVGATMPAANSWLSTVRYQLWLLVPLALGLAYVVDHLRSMKTSSARGALVFLLVVMAWSYRTPYSLMAEVHPETAQLQVWRQGYQALPAKARVGIPTGEHGRFNLQVPDVELKRARPDVELRAFSQLRDRPDLLADGPVFAFVPLPCRVDLTRDAVPADASKSECALLNKIGTWSPFFVRPIMVKAPYEGLEGWWNLHPYPAESVEIGFYRLEK
jgi:hypothetical protein